MKIDPRKVKELMLIFCELGDEYQIKLLGEAYKFQFMQSQLDKMGKEKLNYKSKHELQAEVEKRTNETLREGFKILEAFKDVDETGKAALFMLINQLAKKGNVINESDIQITVNQKEISMKEYIQKHLPNARYEEANKMIQDYLEKAKTK